jgi:mitotic spindle assembly checkpoint protein MAD2
MAQKQATRTNQAITLKGSTVMVSEFFEYSVNSILYQRGVYPSDDFRYANSSRTRWQSADGNRMVKKYGIPMLITSDDNLKEYISTILAQVQGMSECPSPSLLS